MWKSFVDCKQLFRCERLLLFLKELLVKRSLHLWLGNQSKSPLNLGEVFSGGRTVMGKERGEEQGPCFFLWQNTSKAVAIWSTEATLSVAFPSSFFSCDPFCI